MFNNSLDSTTKEIFKSHNSENYKSEPPANPIKNIDDLNPAEELK
jgi:hypothetical protein